MRDKLPKLPSIDDLWNLLRFETEDGQIWLAEERMILFRSSEMRALRRELIESIGLERAKGLLTRMGYIAGQKDADTAKKLRPDASFFDVFSVGPQSHMLTGQAKVIPISIELDEQREHFEGVFEWENSFEAEVFLAEYGVSVDPVCWSQIGYASGYTTRFIGRQVLFRELSCAGCGDKKCVIEGRLADEWPDAEDLLQYYQPNRIADLLLELQSQVVCLRETVSEEKGFGDMVGSSENFLRVRDLLVRAADSKVTVMLLGETGVGKDLFANALHKASPRSDKPFVAVNCAAIPKDLIEAELFGVKKGAFTGADQSRIGRFERADGGTLFLDEVGELSARAQGVLLRVLQDGELERVGGGRTRQVDVRLIAATNQNLEQAVADGRFRSDLLYRLNVYTVVVPPLRERIDDIADLVKYFTDKYSSLHGKQVDGISDKAMSLLRSYQWPGNIRELANVIERGVILVEQGGSIEAAHLFPNVDEPIISPSAAGPANLSISGAMSMASVVDQLLDEGCSLEQLEETLMTRALGKADGNVTRAAKMLGLSRATLDYRLRKSRIPVSNRMGRPRS
jgi:DNA-binding NtrC family response regulator